MVVRCMEQVVGRATDGGGLKSTGCGRLYDDAEQWTICPHGPLWAPPDAYCREHDLVNCTMHGV